MEENIIKKTKSTISNKSKLTISRLIREYSGEVALCRVEETMNTNH